MSLQTKSVALFIICFHATTNAFSFLSDHSQVNSFPKRTLTYSTSLKASSVNSNEESKNAGTSMDLEEARKLVPPALLLSEEELWEQQLNSKQIQEVRKELVLKYTSLGKSPEVAETEVDEFLSDKERCQQYLEMRTYAQAQADDLADFTTVGQLGLAFIIGLIGTVGPKLYNAYQVREIS